MIQGGTRFAVTLVATVLVALALAACGSGPSSSSEPSSGSTSAGESGSGSVNPESSPRRRGPISYTAKEVSVPLKVSGGGSEQFIVKGGDNSIQEFGDEGGASELEAAAKAVHDFFLARATGRWSDACSRLSAILRKKLERLAEKSISDKGCAPFLKAFTVSLPASAWREIITIDAASLRREDDHAFLIYTGSGEAVYAMPLKEEEGKWKVTSLASTELAGA